jgi:hypothetical protein
MRYAIINESLVENVIVADKEFVEVYYPQAIECPETVYVGWNYVDGEFIAPPPVISEEVAE